jgi:glycogen debranching enzyme
VLHHNWRHGVRRRDGVPYAFTCPGPPRYRHQWHWDSCFHAVSWMAFDPNHAREELRTLLRSGRPDGFLPHTVFWGSPAGWRRAPLYATAGVFGDTHTETIDPPLLAMAWERVAAGDRAFVDEGLPMLATHLDWLAHHRDPDDDGLLTILLPDESGLDDSPKYDPVYGRYAHHRVGYGLLIENCRRYGWDSRRIIASTDLHVEDVLVNVAYALSLRAMGRMSGDAAWTARAQRTEAALMERCHDPASGLFWDLAGRTEKAVHLSTWASLAPLALPNLPEDVRRRLVEEHILHPRRYHAPVGIPSVAIEEPSFNPRFDRWRCWRGPSWVNTAWLLVPSMRELGYVDEADRIVTSLAEAALREGFREYYDPRDGAGLAAKSFGWSTLLVDLL